MLTLSMESCGKHKWGLIFIHGFSLPGHYMLIFLTRELYLPLHVYINIFTTLVPTTCPCPPYDMRKGLVMGRWTNVFPSDSLVTVAKAHMITVHPLLRDVGVTRMFCLIFLRITVIMHLLEIICNLKKHVIYMVLF